MKGNQKIAMLGIGLGAVGMYFLYPTLQQWLGTLWPQQPAARMAPPMRRATNNQVGKVPHSPGLYNTSYGNALITLD